jgi:hypothetical protein
VVVWIKARLRRYLTDAKLISAGAVVAASTGEPALAYQLERINADLSADPPVYAETLRAESTESR